MCFFFKKNRVKRSIMPVNRLCHFRVTRITASSFGRRLTCYSKPKRKHTLSPLSWFSFTLYALYFFSFQTLYHLRLTIALWASTGRHLLRRFQSSGQTPPLQITRGRVPQQLYHQLNQYLSMGSKPSLMSSKIVPWTLRCVFLTLTSEVIGCFHVIISISCR